MFFHNDQKPIAARDTVNDARKLDDESTWIGWVDHMVGMFEIHSSFFLPKPLYQYQNRFLYMFRDSNRHEVERLSPHFVPEIVGVP